MTSLRILIGNEPRSYREAISGAIECMRPDAEVLIVEPEELDEEVGRGPAGMVLCSCVTPVVEKGSLAWVELYPGGGPGSRIGVDGLRLTAAGDLSLADILWIADRAESLARERGTGEADGTNGSGAANGRGGGRAAGSRRR